ncbi:MAG: czcD [Frankiales bacterium]|nr:czcD [Frankiales bacterium]
MSEGIRGEVLPAVPAGRSTYPGAVSGPLSGHSHSHHTGTAAQAHRGRLTVVLGITVAILMLEVAGAAVAHSLALLADAGHMAADAAGISLSLLAVIWSSRPATKERTFGYHRAEILAAVVNAVLLLGIGLFVLVEAVRRLQSPGESRPGLMAAIGLVAVLGNALSLRLLHSGRDGSLNVRGAYLEVLSDLLGAAGVLVAAGVIAATGWQRADAIASLLIALLIVPRTVRLLRQAVDVLLEATPEGIDLDDVRRHICETPGVLSCHDLHAWTITSGNPVLSAHVVVSDAIWSGGGAPALLDRLGECLSGHFDLDHSTFQLEQSTHADHEPALHA